jgi:hypothetical protein
MVPREEPRDQLNKNNLHDDKTTRSRMIAFYRASHGTAILKVGRKYKCYGGFHKMNEVGKYCGYLLGTKNTIKQARDFFADVVMFPLGALSAK